MRWVYAAVLFIFTGFVSTVLLHALNGPGLSGWQFLAISLPAYFAGRVVSWLDLVM